LNHLNTNLAMNPSNAEVIATKTLTAQHEDVAQVSNLLYRRLPAGSACKQPARPIAGDVCGLEIRDTADWKSALQEQSALPDVAQVSNLPYRQLPPTGQEKSALREQSVVPPEGTADAVRSWIVRDWSRPGTIPSPLNEYF